ncbi:hypothetical protein GWK47_035776 [Chionoecetes opilio]|uniref:Fibronectin type-III domain-containing protein n=1 Tax=Chionoecetes opilio TaxID=41210 RepID=A0A8J4YMZ9_CHIOP|nr:hypothetical protein GWK47_035776 [Chionoecetes opilio]
MFSDPSQVEDLKADENMTSFILTWQEPKPFTGVIALYNVSLFHNGVLKQTMNVTDTSAKFQGLSAGEKYVAKVKSCNMENKCSDEVNITAWTWPDPPQVHETQEVLKPTSSAINVRLPTLDNPPAWHWLLLKRNQGTRNKDLERNIKEEGKQIVMREVMNRQNGTWLFYDGTLTEDTKLRVVAVIEEGKKNKLRRKKRIVRLDNDISAGLFPLKKNVEYVLLVVTEKRAGNTLMTYQQRGNMTALSPHSQPPSDPDLEVKFLLSIFTALAAPATVAVAVTAAMPAAVAMDTNDKELSPPRQAWPSHTTQRRPKGQDPAHRLWRVSWPKIRVLPYNREAQQLYTTLAQDNKPLHDINKALRQLQLPSLKAPIPPSSSVRTSPSASPPRAVCPDIPCPALLTGNIFDVLQSLQDDDAPTQIPILPSPAASQPRRHGPDAHGRCLT